MLSCVYYHYGCLSDKMANLYLAYVLNGKGIEVPLGYNRLNQRHCHLSHSTRALFELKTSVLAVVRHSAQSKRNTLTTRPLGRPRSGMLCLQKPHTSLEGHSTNLNEAYFEELWQFRLLCHSSLIMVWQDRRMGSRCIH